MTPSRAARAAQRSAGPRLLTTLAGLALAVALTGLQAAPPPANWALDRINQRELPLDGRTDRTGTGEGVTIYVVDTGVRLSHPEFTGRIHAVGNFWADAIGADVDDCATPNGHGTLNASLAAGTTFGVAPRARLEVLRAAGGPRCDGTAEATRRAVEWITANGRRPAVVNISFRFADERLNEAIHRSIAAGFVYTLSAGTAGNVQTNWGTTLAGEALIAAGTDRQDRAMRDDYGPALTLFAPAVSVTGAGRQDDGRGWTPTRDESGDSYAAPLVAGAAALYLQRQPAASPRDVRAAIVAGATPGVIRNPGEAPNRLLYVR